MFKFRRLLCAVLVCALVGVAYGVTVKLKAFENVAEPGEGDGMAIMNYNQGQDETINQIILSGLIPNTAYVVVVEAPDQWCRDGGNVQFRNYDFAGDGQGDGYVFFVGDFGSDGSLVTDNNGHLTLHGDAAPGDYSNSDVLVFLYSDWLVLKNTQVYYCKDIPVRMISLNPAPGVSRQTCPTLHCP